MLFGCVQVLLEAGPIFLEIVRELFGLVELGIVLIELQIKFFCLALQQLPQFGILLLVAC